MVKKIGKILSVFTAVTMTFTMMNPNVFAEEVTQEGNVAEQAATADIHIVVKNSVSEGWVGDLDYDVTLLEGETGYDALVRALDANGYTYTISEASWGHSIDAIGGVENDTVNWSSYWSLYYNKEYASYGVDGYEFDGTDTGLKDGDELAVVYYPTEYPGDEGDDDDDVDDDDDRVVVPFETLYDDTMSIIDTALSGDALAYENEWKIIILARTGKLKSEKAEAYYKSVEEKVKSVGSATLDGNYATTNARVILALTAIGKNPARVAGYNLLEPLADMNYVKRQGLNAAVYTLIAFDSHKYDIPKVSGTGVQTTREGLVQYILDNELEGGGWAYSGTTADPDMTAMAMEALAPYYRKDTDNVRTNGSTDEVKSAVDRGVSVLSAMQNDDGSFSSWGSANSNSIAQVMTALTSIGIDPMTDERFIKNGSSMTDALSDYYVEGQGFLYMKDSAATDDYSLNQVGYALAAERRYKDNKTSLYDMSDVNIENDEATTEITTEVTTEATTEKLPSPKTGDTTPLAAVLTVMMLMIGGIVVTGRKKER